jgi:hypothetical protein
LETWWKEEEIMAIPKVYNVGEYNQRFYPCQE